MRHTTPSAWRAALQTGRLPASAEPGDLALAVDPRRDGGPDLPTAAVTATALPPDPLPGPDDEAGRADAHLLSFRRRRARTELPVAGGYALRDDRFPDSHDHNALVVTEPQTAATLAAEADRTQAALTYRHVLLGPRAAAAADALAADGWAVQRLLRMVLRPGEHRPARTDQRAEQVAPHVARHLWRRSWREELPDLTDDVLRQLLERERFDDEVVRVHDLAVFVHNLPVAGAQIRIDGATAALDTVLTLRAHRGAGRSAAAVDAALGMAEEAGCDLVVLEADADDWPHEWYARLGFRVVGTSAGCRRPAPA